MAAQHGPEQGQEQERVQREQVQEGHIEQEAVLGEERRQEPVGVLLVVAQDGQFVSLAA